MSAQNNSLFRRSGKIVVALGCKWLYWCGRCCIDVLLKVSGSQSPMVVGQC